MDLETDSLVKSTSGVGTAPKYVELVYEDTIPRYCQRETTLQLNQMCFDSNICQSMWNPLYSVLYVSIFIFEFLGVCLHQSCHTCIPISTGDELEHEVRVMWIYTINGSALLTILIDVVFLISIAHYRTENDLQSKLLVAFATIFINILIILSNSLALIDIAFQMIRSYRVFVVGQWIIVLILTSFIVSDSIVIFSRDLSFSSLFVWFFHFLEVFVYVWGAVVYFKLWVHYDITRQDVLAKPSEKLHIIYQVVLVLILALSLGICISASNSSSWQILGL